MDLEAMTCQRPLGVLL